MLHKLACLILLGLLMLSIQTPARGATLPPPHLGYGMMVAYPKGNLDLVRDAGFDWYKHFIRWDEIDGDHNGDYNWESLDWRLDESCATQLNGLLLVSRQADNWTPIQDAELPAWETFFENLTAHIAQRRADCDFSYRVAIEVWNEPNLDFQWGNQPVDPARYTEMVKRAYRGAKRGDPRSFIVVGSLAPTGGTSDGLAMDDVAFLRAMYAAGLKGNFDAISVHNYGYGGAPEDKAWGSGILNFRRAEDIYQVMVDHGDGDKPVWGTEFGWLRESAACAADWNESGFGWQQVTEAQQADYLPRAFAYAEANWPWMEVMIVSNLDFNTMPLDWYKACDPLRGFSILNADLTPTQAYTSLAQMEKRPSSLAPTTMEVAPTSLTWMVPTDGAGPLSRQVTVHTSGDAFRWNVSIASPDLDVTVTPMQGVAGDTFTVEVNPSGKPQGIYLATLTVTADSPGVLASPIELPLRLLVTDLYEAHLPFVQKP